MTAAAGQVATRVRPLLIALTAATVGLAKQALGYVQDWQHLPARRRACRLRDTRFRSR